MSAPSRRRPPTTKEAWIRFANAERPVRPEALSLSEYRKLSTTARDEYDLGRRRFHGALGPYQIGAAKRIVPNVAELLEGNDQLADERVRPSAAIEGQPNLGKTTLLRELGRLYERRRRDGFGWYTEEGDEYLPVASIGLPIGAYVSGLNSKLATFYNVPLRQRENQTRLHGRLIDVMDLCCTEVLLIDDVHHAMGDGKRQRDLNDYIKQLMNELAVTVLVAGVDLAEGGFFEEGRSEQSKRRAQIGDRFRHFEVEPLGIDTEAGAREWLRLLSAISNDLVLIIPGEPLAGPELREYVYQRTAGSIGRVMELVRGGLAKAMLEERRRGGRPHGLTRELLDSVPLSRAAEKARTTKVRSNGARNPRRR